MVGPFRAGRLRSAVTSLKPARAACHPWAAAPAEEARTALTRRSQRLRPRVRGSHSMNTGRRRQDDGSTPAYLDNGGGTGCPGSRMSSSFSFLPGLK